MLVSELLNVLEGLAPAALAEPGDNCGLLAGDESSVVCRILSSLELTGPVLEEALAGDFDTVLTHHPLLFSPVRSLVESRPTERLLRRLAVHGVTLVACHTNLDAAPGGLAEIAGEALGLGEMVPLRFAAAGWYKLAGFIPAEAVEDVAAAVFAAGAGSIGLYEGCAYAASGTGWFTAQPGSRPAVGDTSSPERTPEMRWETVVPRGHLTRVIRAYVAAHPYEEPAFDVYPVEDVIPRSGLGRIGTLREPTTVSDLAALAVSVFELSGASWSGDGSRVVQRVAVLPGGGRSLLEAAGGQCDVLLTGDVGYHSAGAASEVGMSLIDLPHGEFEWWAFKQWTQGLEKELGDHGVEIARSRTWHSPWMRVLVAASGSKAEEIGEGAVTEGSTREAEDVGGDQRTLRIWVDGGSRGNPGPSAIGIVVEDASGEVVSTVGRVIEAGTNNVAEYRALLTALETAADMSAAEIEIFSDSELLVKQMTGEYKVKNAGLRPLHAEALNLARGFRRFSIRHVGREDNSRADALVNRALDEQQRTGL